VPTAFERLQENCRREQATFRMPPAKEGFRPCQCAVPEADLRLVMELEFTMLGGLLNLLLKATPGLVLFPIKLCAILFHLIKTNCRSMICRRVEIRSPTRQE
jgi:hypothetical protein